MTNAVNVAEITVKFLREMFATKPVAEVHEYFDNLLDLSETDRHLRSAVAIHYLIPLGQKHRPVTVRFLEKMLERLGLPTEVSHLSLARHLIACELRKRYAAEKGIVAGSKVMCKGNGPFNVISIDDKGYVVTDGPGRAYRPDNIELAQ